MFLSLLHRAIILKVLVNCFWIPTRKVMMTVMR